MIFEVLSSTGYEVSKDAFPTSHTPKYPFIVYETPFTNNVSADNTTYVDVDRYYVRLYSKGRHQDTTAYKTLVDVLKANDIAYEKASEYYIRDEEHHETLIEFNYLMEDNNE